MKVDDEQGPRRQQSNCPTLLQRYAPAAAKRRALGAAGTDDHGDDSREASAERCVAKIYSMCPVTY